MRRLVLALLMLLVPATGFAQLAIPGFWDTKERLAKPDVAAIERVRFLTTIDFPPFNFLDGSGRLTGFHIDLARAICGELEIMEKCQVQALPWNELDPALQAGDGEAIIAGMAVTAETRATHAFTRSYLRFPGRFITLKANALAEPIYSRIAGKKVGVVAGSAHEKILRDYFPDAVAVSLPTQEALLADLKGGKVDVAFGDGMKLGFWLSGSDSDGCCRFSGGPYLAPEYLGNGLAIATRADNPQLAVAFDYALQQLAAKGTFAELYLRYFPVSFF